LSERGTVLKRTQPTSFIFQEPRTYVSDHGIIRDNFWEYIPHGNKKLYPDVQQIGSWMGPRAGLDVLLKDMPLAPVRNRSQVVRRHHHSLVTTAGTTLFRPSICENEN